MALIKERTKKRKGENAIGKIIYGFLLFAPLMVIAFTSLYAVLNKNAYQSYYGETINEVLYEHIDYTELKPNENYVFRNELLEQSEQQNSTSTTMNVANLKNVQNITQDLSEVNKIYFNISNYRPAIYFYKDGTEIAQRLLTTNNIEFEFEFLGFQNPNYNVEILSNTLYYIKFYNKYSYLDNNFEYGCYKAENSTLFNWAKNTGTYEVLETTTTGLGITNTFIPFLMAYWLLISVIYFIFDIALILIWMVHDKIHELKDSI